MTRIKKLEERVRRLEYDTKDSLWLLNHPPRFKHGDQVSYDESDGFYHRETIDRLTILSEKEIVKHDDPTHYWMPSRTYFASVGGIDAIGKYVIVVKEHCLTLINEEKN